MKRAILLFLTFFCFLYFFSNADDKAIMVKNTVKEIDDCKGKLNLKLVRVWGGDEEEDENKFFNTPIAVLIDGNKSVYICDLHDHSIKVFDYLGRYLRTTGRRGQGPGDLLGPNLITFTTGGDLLVYEMGGQRLQWFSNTGKSKQILKYNGILAWIGVTSRNEIALYDSYKTFMKRKLITIIDNKGKIRKEFGSYHDKSKDYLNSEKLIFAMDKSDNFFAADMGTPIIRKYSPDGFMKLAITFETPLNILVEISLNANGDEIEKKEEIEVDEGIRMTESSHGISIQQTNGKGKKRIKTGICIAIRIDSNNRIYIVTSKRYLSKKEDQGTYISGNFSRLDRSGVNYDIVENIDAYKLLVFNQNGKVIAESPLTTFCDDIYINDNRIFIIDGFLNQRILEYEMTFKN